VSLKSTTFKFSAIVSTDVVSLRISEVGATGAPFNVVPERLCGKWTHFVYVGFVVLTALTMMNIAFWNVMRCSPLEVRRFGGMQYRHLQG
jgi:hypothetical protein